MASLEKEPVPVNKIQDVHFRLTSPHYRDVKQKFVWFEQDFLKTNQHLESERRRTSHDLAKQQRDMHTKLYQLTVAREQTRLQKKISKALAILGYFSNYFIVAILICVAIPHENTVRSPPPHTPFRS
jgi:hypothetical protein